MSRFRVLVVDDSAYARSGVRDVLDADPDFEVVGEAADGQEAVAAAERLRPDLVLMDVRMPGLGGIAATARLKARLPEVRVVMLSVSDDAQDLFEAVRGGAQGYLLKNLEPETWCTYLRQIMSGETPVSREIATRILQEFAQANPEPAVPLEILTARETEVLRLVAVGLSNREIARRLDVSEATVKNHLRNVLGKLQLRNRTALAAFAFRSGLVSPPGRAGRG